MDPMEALKVDLEFVSGRKSLAVSDFTGIRTGSVLTLEMAPAMFQIVAHGRLMGEGRLVEVNGRMAVVEITAWNDGR
jgi:flagellar motor switch/type III secretory pathway protein FliN